MDIKKHLSNTVFFSKAMGYLFLLLLLYTAWQYLTTGQTEDDMITYSIAGLLTAMAVMTLISERYAKKKAISPLASTTE